LTAFLIFRFCANVGSRLVLFVCFCKNALYLLPQPVQPLGFGIDVGCLIDSDFRPDKYGSMASTIQTVAVLALTAVRNKKNSGTPIAALLQNKPSAARSTRTAL